MENEKKTALESQPKYKSWALWLSVAALVVFCVKEFSGIDLNETANGLMNLLLPVLIGLGIVNNPDSKTSI